MCHVAHEEEIAFSADRELSKTVCYNIIGHKVVLLCYARFLSTYLFRYHNMRHNVSGREHATWATRDAPRAIYRARDVLVA